MAEARTINGRRKSRQALYAEGPRKIEEVDRGEFIYCRLATSLRQFWQL